MFGAAAELGEGPRDDRAGQVGRALERGVVVHHHMVVGGEADIELEGVHPEVGGALEGGQGVLGRLGGGAAVPDEGAGGDIHQDVHRIPMAHRPPSPLGGEGDRG